MHLSVEPSTSWSTWKQGSQYIWPVTKLFQQFPSPQRYPCHSQHTTNNNNWVYKCVVISTDNDIWGLHWRQFQWSDRDFHFSLRQKTWHCNWSCCQRIFLWKIDHIWQIRCFSHAISQNSLIAQAINDHSQQQYHCNNTGHKAHFVCPCHCVEVLLHPFFVHYPLSCVSYPLLCVSEEWLIMCFDHEVNCIVQFFVHRKLFICQYSQVIIQIQ